MAKKGNIVNKSKNNLKFIMLALVAVGWLCTVMTLTENEDEEAQEALILQAQKYLEDDIYIRAVNNYKKAINNYTTDRNQQLQTELLEIYLEAEMMDEYYSLIESRIGAKTAEEQEYLALASYYLEKNSIAKAVSILQSGIALYENEEMIMLREQNIYENSRKEIGTQELIQPSEDWIIPAFNGEKWGYLNQKGDIKLNYIYDEVTRFCNGYAVVKLDGVYNVINEQGQRYGLDKNNLDGVADISAKSVIGIKDGKYYIYSYAFNLRTEEAFDAIYVNDNGLYVVRRDDKWAVLDSELEVIVDYELTDVAVNSTGNVFNDNYAMVNDGTGYYRINAKGQAGSEIRFADAKGYEGGLTAVANEEGKWGFCNSSGELIVDFQYEEAMSFSSNLAAVKVRGKWGYINRYNDMIIDADYEEANPFVGEKALVKNSLGHYELITLKHYDLFN